MMQGHVQRYFVLHLEIGEDRPSPELAYEVQILDREGRARACGHVGESDTRLAVSGEEVPFPVIEAARRQPYGKGDYVTATGESAPPF
jgi:hypothetical protein